MNELGAPDAAVGPAALASASPSVATASEVDERGGGGSISGGSISPERLGAFTDGVIAIAATLLILDVRIPAAGDRVWPFLQNEWPALAAYASTFLIIGIVWIHHHNLFHQVQAVDRGLLFMNIGMLLTIAFLPLPTATLGDHLGGADATAAAVFWGLSMVAASSWFTIFWNHLVHHPELLRPASRPTAAARRRGALLGPIAYLIATLAALLSPYATVGVSAAVIAYFIVGPNAPAAATRVGRT